uniref:Uncharacterized protein n=1 Tax=Arundo donax TaxID=35708 RepID=A0A0A8YNS1_ARUDO
MKENVHFATFSYLVCPLNTLNKISTQFILANYLSLGQLTP